MNRFQTNLRIPGPTSLPDAAREAGSRQMINHRGPEFAGILERVGARMKPFFGTENQIMFVGCSGTGGLEAAVVNTLSPGDKVLGISIGAFGDRIAKIASVYGADVTKLDVEWGTAADPERVKEALRAGSGWKAVLMTHNETSTSVMNPVKEIAAAVREVAPDAVIIMDGVSSLGGVAFEQDAWGSDVVISGSQKSWMAAPGVAFVSMSERAWKANETAKMPRFYLDLGRHRDALANKETPWTPAIGVMFQLDATLAMMEAEGKEAIFARHHACAHATRAGLAALGFRLFADQAHASITVTGAWIPEGMDWKAYNARLKEAKLVLAGGQAHLKGKIFRVGHLGTVVLDEILGALSVMEEAAIEMGMPIVPGTAISAAQRAALEVLHPDLAVRA